MSTPQSTLTPDATATYQKHVEAAAADLRDRVGALPDTALLLGPGGSAITEHVDVEATCGYSDLPHFPTGDRGGADGTITVGTLDSTPVVVLDAPLPLHDGYTPREVVFPVRMLGVAGVETLLLTGFAGGLRPSLSSGALMLVTDHVNFQGVNPLVGPNVEDWGPRFPDMSEPYDPEVRRAAEAVARKEGLGLRKGVYLAALGPNLGTGAEYQMMRTLGADAVGMGLVPEVIAARHMDLRVGAVVVITDRCTPDATPTISADQMATAADAARPAVRRLLTGVTGTLETEAAPA